MSSKSVCVKVPGELYDVFEAHARDLGYSSVPQFLLWTGVYSIMIGKPHRLTAPISQSSKAMQEKVVDEVIERFNAGEPMRESFFESVLRDALTQLGLEGKEEVVQAVIAEQLRKRDTKKRSGTAEDSPSYPRRKS